MITIVYTTAGWRYRYRCETCGKPGWVRSTYDAAVREQAQHVDLNHPTAA